MLFLRSTFHHINNACSPESMQESLFLLYLDRPQSQLYFVPQESHSQAGLALIQGKYTDSPEKVSSRAGSSLLAFYKNTCMGLILYKLYRITMCCSCIGVFSGILGSLKQWLVYWCTGRVCTLVEIMQLGSQALKLGGKGRRL